MWQSEYSVLFCLLWRYQVYRRKTANEFENESTANLNRIHAWKWEKNKE